MQSPKSINRTRTRPPSPQTERDLALVISRLEEFSAKVTTGLDNLDRLGMRDIVRTVVRRI